MIIQKAREAFPDIDFPRDNGFYSGYMQGWIDIFQNEPSWKSCRAGGLKNNGFRSLNMLGTAKILCDLFARKCFSEQLEVTCSDERYKEFLDSFMDREGFWKNIPHVLAKGFCRGGFLLREYADRGNVRLDYVNAENFVPLSWDNTRITEGLFGSCIFRRGKYYTLFERHYLDGGVRVENSLFCSETPSEAGTRVPLSEVYPDMNENSFFDMDTPLFQYFRTDFSSNIPTELPLGVSCFANSADTLKALDIAFDSFAREFILGKKRIIVPSPCIRTVVDPDTGEVSRYFDADDEVYQALKCDEEKDLKIIDNTTELRVTEHVEGINALLNILCAQVGLSPGTLSFDKSEGIKTATEVISQESKSAETIRCNKNLLTETFEQMCRAVINLAVWSGQLPKADYTLSVSFRDNIITDDNTVLENNVKLVQAGLKPKVDAIMEVLKCDEETARKKLEQIRKENAAEFESGNVNFGEI